MLVNSSGSNKGLRESQKSGCWWTFMAVRRISAHHQEYKGVIIKENIRG